jgi:hypothetical protein
MRIMISGILLFCLMAVSGQQSSIIKIPAESDDPFIKWIGTIPSAESSGNDGFFEKIFNFIVGKELVVFNNPVSIFANGRDDYFIVNQGEGNIIKQKDGKTEVVHVFKKPENIFPSLIGICHIDNLGYLFSDSKLNKVYILADNGKQISAFNDSDTLTRPTGVAFSEKTGEVWVVETGSNRISVYDRSGHRIKTIGQRGTGRLEFNFPTYIWIDRSGKVYIVDSMNYRVQILSAEGEFINSFGKQGDATGFFARPRGIATDSQGNIYVVDALFDVIQIFNISGKLLYYFGTHGNGKSQFWMPSGIFIDKSDNIYVSDSYNGRVQIFQLTKTNQQ